jgi:hypothetical protein
MVPINKAYDLEGIAIQHIRDYYCEGYEKDVPK